MVLKLFNTLTRTKEEFKPLRPREARLYHCGPTVYNFVHIGNLRAYVLADILRRTLEHNGYEVKQVLNITDVGEPTSDESEDKMAKGLRREGKPFTLEAMSELGEFYTKAFLQDLQSLNIQPPSVMPRASKYIKEDIEIIDILLKKDIAYKISDLPAQAGGIYFDTSKFPEYGTRGGFKLGDTAKESARIAINLEKRNARDFALWKFASSDLPSFQSPFGPGFPGWHIECSAMSRKYLGQPFDIHTGGIDHIPTHHQNEIAQSEAAYGVPLANYWLHSEFVKVPSGEKMSKSEENFLTLKKLTEKGIHPLAYRYYLLQTHYRSPLQFSWEALAGAQTAYFKLLHAFAGLRGSRLIGDLPPVRRRGGKRQDIINDDLNTPVLLAHLWELVKEKNRSAILDADRILGLDIENQAQKLAEETKNIPDEIQKLAGAREDARRAKDFKTSDALRVQIEQKGFTVSDTNDGSIIRRVGI
ncbi:MAG: cysteinyl-tRNA synthetase [Parcubacteria group bacterium Gr01-1014_17]|nr:MAG: cysteinyl-tRNA synthetase [Parcubacteria group bacterium Gr01-1014_17]